MNTTATGIYVRVSTYQQNEESQIAEITRWLEGNGIDPATVKWFIDKGKTGNNLNRPAFEELQKAIFQGEVKTVVCYKLDRLSRSLRDGINTLADWTDKGIRVVATSQQLDFNGTMGKMLASILFAFSEMEQETRKERQFIGIQYAKTQGIYKGRNKGATKAKPSRALELRSKGLTLPEIAKSMGISERSVFRYLATVA